MIRTTITVETPDLTRRGMSKVYRAGIDEAFKRHRKQALPRHFRASATTRYGSAYRGENRQRKRAYWRQQFQDMTPEQRRAKRAQLARRRDPQNRLPLVETGRLKRTVLTGRAILTGPVLTRRMVLQSLPPYTTRRTPGTLDKVRAIQAVHPSEEKAFATTVDTAVQKHLSTNTRKRRS